MRTIDVKCSKCQQYWSDNEYIKLNHKCKKIKQLDPKPGNTMEYNPQGTKFDSEKPRMDLLSAEAITQLAKVLTFGSRKYDAYNWSKGIAFSRVIAAILRHTMLYLSGETTDPETGLS